LLEDRRWEGGIHLNVPASEMMELMLFMIFQTQPKEVLQNMCINNSVYQITIYRLEHRNNAMKNAIIS
jgi:hypothetical protein